VISGYLMQTLQRFAPLAATECRLVAS
jgi:hypothetical protein